MRRFSAYPDEEQLRPIVPLVWYQGERGRQEGQVATIEKLVRTGVAWSTIEAATGIDQETFDRLKHRFESADDEEPHEN